MATQADVRRIALALPDVVEAPDKFAFSVVRAGNEKGFVWVWMERVTPKQPKVPNAGVIAARVANVAQRDLMIATEPAKFFTEPHYARFPAVLVRLEAVGMDDLELLVGEAWRCQAQPPAAKGGAKRAARTRKH